MCGRRNRSLLTNYCFPSEIRAKLVQRLASLLPAPLEKVFLLTTGSETVECAIKLCRTEGLRVGGRAKNVIVSYEKAFHGRTLGSQQAGGIPSLKDWIVNFDPGFVQIPFPDGFRTEDTSFAGFERALREHGVEAQNVAGVILETYQGGSGAFAPVEYMQALREWCTAQRRAAGLRRSAGRFRTHRDHVRLRALWHRSRPRNFRQRHLQFAAAGGGRGTRRYHGPASLRAA